MMPRIIARAMAGAVLSVLAAAGTPVLAAGEVPPPPFTLEAARRNPTQFKAQFLDYIAKYRPATERVYLDLRFERAMDMVGTGGVKTDKELRAFLLLPREEFVIHKRDLPRSYERDFLDIGYGVTISGPALVSKMTSELDVKPGDKALEIGTGSGYQSGYLSELTDQVYSIEIIAPLSERTGKNYQRLIAAGYPEFANIRQKQADGYWGWEENGPFDKIIVTCAIDHVPPALLQQLAVGGTMIIPVGPPGKQTMLKVTKVQDADGKVTIKREDVYRGRLKVSFVPFTKAGGGTWSGGKRPAE